ncbi:hypothetical protein BGX28_007613 [Mortierella sp. GBA30]|nr:hypothetical protein BGX28_007613 [Mortierella sp. GBA30]
MIEDTLDEDSTLATQNGLRKARAKIDDFYPPQSDPGSVSLETVTVHDRVTTPSNLTTPESDALTPKTLRLIDVNQSEIDRLASMVPGGISNIQDICSLSPLQEGILLHHLLANEGDPYLLMSTVAFESRALLNRYLIAFQTVVDRHDILRTSFFWENLSSSAQVVHRSVPFPVEEPALDPADGDITEQLYRLFNPQHYRIDLCQAPLLRFIVAKGADDRWILVQLMHRLIVDYEAEGDVHVELKALLDGQGSSLPKPVSFRDQVAEIRLRSSHESDEVFFREMLMKVDEPTFPFGLIKVDNGAKVKESRQVLPQELNDRLRFQARRQRVSLASLCHVAWGQVLARTSAQQRVVFGTVLSGRLQAGDKNERALGLSMNMLPFLCNIDKRSALECAQDAHSRIVGILEHKHASLALAQRCSSVPTGTPLFSGLLNYRQSSRPSDSIYGASNAELANPEGWLEYAGIQLLSIHEHTRYPFGMSVDDFGTGLRLTAQVTHPIDPARICAYMQQALESLTEALEDTTETSIQDLEVLPAEERDMMLGDWNATEEDYPDHCCLHHLFEQQVERTPEAVAVVYEDRSLTYAELNSRANCLARQLIKLGVRPDMPVAICVKRSFALIAGLLAILKAGGAYLPLDPFYSSGRLRDILKDTAPTILLADQVGKTTLGEEALSSLIVVDPSTPQQKDANNPQLAQLTSRHLAYIIYTSGSTGKPKGVTIEHQGAVNLVHKRPELFGIHTESRVLQFGSFNFSHSVSEIFSALTSGASLYLLDDDSRLDRYRLWDILQRHSITHVSLTSSLLHDCKDLPPLKSLQALITAGEAVSATLLPALRAMVPNGTIIINYGSSETTTGVTIWKCPKNFSGALVPIGRPAPNKRVYLLDTQGNPVPLGTVGEIYVGGVGLARGYWKKPELSSERFVPDHFVGGTGARMYRTGDLARYLSDGNLVYVCRNDHQVKIRGFRIELGEIEARLTEHPALSKAVVVAKGEETSKRLVAYVIVKSEDNPTESTVGNRCK